MRIRNIVRKLIPKNDHVRNRDRQDPSAVIKLAKPELRNFLNDLGYVSCSIIPEITKFTTDNKPNMYKNIIDVEVGKHGYIYMLYDFSNDKCTSSLLSARLHKPLDNIRMLKREVLGKELHYCNGVLYICGYNTQITYLECEKGSVTLNIGKLRKKEDVVNKLKEFQLDYNEKDKISTLKSILSDHVKSTSSERKLKFENDELKFEAIHFSHSHLYSACSSLKILAKIVLHLDGISIKAKLEQITAYGSWNCVNSICELKDKLFIAHDDGIDIFDLLSKEYTRYVPNKKVFQVRPFKNGIIFTAPYENQIFYKEEEKDLAVFAGNGDKIHRLGIVEECSFCKPCGLAVEFDNILYVTDFAANRVNILTPTKETARLLESLHNLYDAFSIHENKGVYELKTLSRALELLQLSHAFLEENSKNIKQTVMEELPKSLNGPQGSVAAKTILSVKMILTGVRRLKAITENQNHKQVNLLSCLTLDVEHFHSTTHFKSITLSMSQYCRSFGAAVKESMKRISDWGVFYYTSRKSWYPLPDGSIDFEDMPVLQMVKPKEMSSLNIDIMRDWANVFGRSVRQRTNRQATTMAAPGTLPEYCYEFQEQEAENVNNLWPSDNENDGVEEVDEYDSDCSSDSENDDDVCNVEHDNVQAVAKEAFFLIGGRSRFGRSVRINSKYVQ